MKYSTRITAWLTSSLVWQASFYEQVRRRAKHVNQIVVPRSILVNFSPSGFIVSEFQRYNIDDLYGSTLHLYISCSHQGMNERLSCHQCRVTAHSPRWTPSPSQQGEATLEGLNSVHWRFQDGKFSSSGFIASKFQRYNEYQRSLRLDSSVMYTCYQGVAVLGV